MRVLSMGVGLSRLFHIVSLIAVAALGIALLGYTLACAFGLAPWLDISATFGGTTYANAGQILQIGLTVIFAAMVSFLPTNARIAALEHSHRRFEVSMTDVAQAYHVAHTADRAGHFSLSAEFDAVRERLAYLRDHPDLDKLEPKVMEIAAQMSQQARHLADVYSDEKVARAKTFLKQRQQEAEAQQERIVEALHVCRELRTWAQQVDIEESVVASQLEQLDEKLAAALPDLGYVVTRTPADSPINVVNLAAKPAAE